MNVVLIGYRGSGKTTVGKILAQKLGLVFVDCDEVIESDAKKSIREIFEAEGEPRFRELEIEAIEAVSKRDGQVIATGGGCVLRRRNVRNLKAGGVVFFLDAPPEAAYERISMDPSSRARRPSLTGKDPLTEVREQMTFRRPYYLGAAEHVIDVSRRAPEELALEILGHLNATNRPGSSS